MKRFTLTLSAFLLILSSFTLLNKVWTNDDAHSQLSFTVTHLGISDVSGTFNDFDATLTSSKEDFSDAIVELKARAASIDTRVEARDKHLKSADFFDVENFPEIHFKSTNLQKVSKDKYKLSGNLTLHGVTKPVSLDLNYRGTVDNPMNKKPTAGFKVTGSIKRSDFNLGNGFPAPMISDEVRIEADGEFFQ